MFNLFCKLKPLYVHVYVPIGEKITDCKHKKRIEHQNTKRKLKLSQGLEVLCYQAVRPFTLQCQWSRNQKIRRQRASLYLWQLALTLQKECCSHRPRNMSRF